MVLYEPFMSQTGGATEVVRRAKQVWSAPAPVASAPTSEPTYRTPVPPSSSPSPTVEAPAFEDPLPYFVWFVDPNGQIVGMARTMVPEGTQWFGSQTEAIKHRNTLFPGEQPPINELPDRIGDAPPATPDLPENVADPLPDEQVPDTPPGPGDPGYFDQDVFSTIQLLLNRYGIGGLTSWVRQLVVEQASAAEIELLLFERQEFKDRFPAIAMIDNDNQGGIRRPNISPEQYLQLENDYFNYLSRVNLSDAFFTRDRVATWIYEGVSPAEVSRRVTNVFSRVNLASNELKAAFSDFYGISGEQALAIYALDPDNTEDVLLRQVEVADIGGRARIADIGIGQEGAERLAELGITPGQATTGFGNINRRRGLFRETATELTDLRREAEGFRSQFNLDAGEADEALGRRLQTRRAAFQGGGGAFIGARGTGFGSV